MVRRNPRRFRRHGKTSYSVGLQTFTMQTPKMCKNPNEITIRSHLLGLARISSHWGAGRKGERIEINEINGNSLVVTRLYNPLHGYRDDFVICVNCLRAARARSRQKSLRVYRCRTVICSPSRRGSRRYGRLEACATKGSIRVGPPQKEPGALSCRHALMNAVPDCPHWKN
jgi:hypothetical protein